MRGINKVILLGNLGKDPEVRTFENGRSVANFSLATTESYKNKEGQKIEQTEWHNVVLWSPLSEIAQKYLKKGGKVYIEGKIVTRSYNDKDGNKRYSTEIVGDNILLLDGPSGSGSDDRNQSYNQEQPQTASNRSASQDNNGNQMVDDDLPF